MDHTHFVQLTNLLSAEDSERNKIILDVENCLHGWIARTFAKGITNCVYLIFQLNDLPMMRNLSIRRWNLLDYSPNSRKPSRIIER